MFPSYRNQSVDLQLTGFCMMGTLVVKSLRDTISLPKELFLFFQVALIEDVENILCGINEGLRINKIGSLCKV